MDDLTRLRGEKIAQREYPEPSHGPAKRVADIARHAFVNGWVSHAQSLEAQLLAAASNLHRAAGGSLESAIEILTQSGLDDAHTQLAEARKRIAELEARLEQDRSE